MELIILFIAVIMLPHIFRSAVSVGEAFFKGTSLLIGGAIFLLGLFTMLGALLS